MTGPTAAGIVVGRDGSGVTATPGFRAAGVAAGLKSDGGMDVAVVLNDGPLVERHMLPDPVTSGHIDTEVGDTATVQDPPSSGRAVDGPMAPHLARRRRVEPLWLTEKSAIEAAIEACDGNINQAAGLLEVAPSTIYRKLQNWKNIPA